MTDSREALIKANMATTGASREVAERAADEILADKREADAEEEARHAQIMAEAEREAVSGRLLMLLGDLDEVGRLTEAGARLYFAVERYLYPANEMFRPENLAATEAKYLKRAGL